MGGNLELTLLLYLSGQTKTTFYYQIIYIVEHRHRYTPLLPPKFMWEVFLLHCAGKVGGLAGTPSAFWGGTIPYPLECYNCPPVVSGVAKYCHIQNVETR